MNDSWGLHWFRRDLRVAGNPALQWNWKQHKGRVLGIFCFDSAFLSRPDFSINRFAFFIDTLVELKNELISIGSDLLTLDIGPRQGFEKLFTWLRDNMQPLPGSLSFNRDYEPFARSRDSAISAWINAEYAIQIHNERDHLLFEPDEISKPDSPGSFYQIYSPFARRWLEALNSEKGKARIKMQREGLLYLASRLEGKDAPPLFSLTWKSFLNSQQLSTDNLEEYRCKNAKSINITIPRAGSTAAFAQLRAFKKQALVSYQEKRDFPAVQGTSGMAIFLKNGSISSSQIIAELSLGGEEFKSTSGPAVYLKEIIWREFYYHILFHNPFVEQQAFLEKFRQIQWENREDLFEAWKQGRTGYPIVDAGMRQLATTGWMHNRVRMIVASFLTKDLHIDWRWGERYFMEKLLDGDLAPNNGGWQWAASTGCDPQPYFRIFNPELQSEKFDPDGIYIKKYVPELAKVSSKLMHAPDDDSRPKDYPKPVVDHQARKVIALEMYSGKTNPNPYSN